MYSICGSVANKYHYCDVFWVDLNNKCTGYYQHKQSGLRPCIIVSNDFNNYFCDLVTIIPVTTKKDNLPQHRSIMLGGRKNYILPEQITTIPKKWLKEKMCHLNDANIQEVKMSLKIQYNL